MAVAEKVIAFRDPGDGPSPERKAAVDLATMFADKKFHVHGKPEHLEQVIYRFRAFLDGISLEDPDRPWIIKQLSFLQRLRSHNSTSTSAGTVSANVQDSLPVTSGSAQLTSFRDLTASLPELDPTKPIQQMTTFRKHVDALTSFSHLTDVADIEDGDKYCQQLLSSYPRSQLAPVARLALSNLFYRAFECTNQVEYLNKAVSAARANINPANPLMNRSTFLSLISQLTTRLNLLGRREDLNDLMQLFPIVASYPYWTFPHQDPISCVWPLIARRFGHPSTSTAYDCAISSMQASLTFAPTLDIQHSRLVAINNSFKTLPFDCASYQILTSRLQEAMETLERGRVLLWSEMRGLRTSIDHVRMADPHLADELTAINRDLEILTFSSSPNNDADRGDSEPEGMDPFGHFVVRRQRLLHDREKVISRIQALPGLDTFLKPPSFDTLPPAAIIGPVIIIKPLQVAFRHHHSSPQLSPIPYYYLRRLL